MQLNVNIIYESKKMSDNTSTLKEKIYGDEEISHSLQISEKENGNIRYECPHYMRKCQFYVKPL